MMMRIGQGMLTRLLRTGFAQVGLTLLVALPACVNVEKTTTQAQAATDEFHARFSEGQFAQIHDDADPEFQKATTGTQLAALLGDHRARLGHFTRATSTRAVEVSRGTNGTVVRVVYDSAFAQGSAEEQFVWKIQGAQARLWKYWITNVSVATLVPTAKRATRPARLMPFRASPDLLEYLRSYYKEQLNLEIEILPELVVDRGAWSDVRRQWSAEGLAEQVRQTVGNQDAVVIGITGEDIYLRSENWQFAFSYRADDRVAVVSYARMDWRLANADVLRRRVRRMVTKDLGIMLYQLAVSDGRTSPMYQSIDGVPDLDAMSDDLASAGFPQRVGAVR
jgi:predicted Zn-dependent protease